MSWSEVNCNLPHCPIPIVIGVTGHRDLRKEDTDLLRVRVEEVFEKLQLDYPHTSIVLLSALADGADRLVAEIALGMSGNGKSLIDLVVPMPMPRHEYEQDFDDESKVEFSRFLEKASLWFELPLCKGSTVEMLRQNDDARNQQYREVGEYVSRNSQILIALWDGVDLHDRVGGTSQTIKARLSGSNTFGEEPLDVPDSGPVYHILTPRKTNPDVDGRIGELREIYPNPSDGEAPNLDYSERKTEEILARMNDFNRISKNHYSSIQDSVAETRNSLIPLEKQTSLSVYENSVLDRFALADAMAIYYQRLSRRTVIGLFIAVLFAIVCFEVYSDILSEPWVLALYPVGLGLSYLIFRFIKQRNLESNYLDFRALAEALRIQLFWSISGLEEKAADHYLRKQQSEIDWIRYAIRNIDFATDLPPIKTPLVEHEAALGSRIRDIVVTHWITDQAKYYGSATLRDIAKSNRRRLIAGFLFGAGMLLSVIVVFLHSTFRGVDSYVRLHNWLVIAMALGPAIAAAIGGYSQKMAYAVQAKRYEWMRQIFGRAERRIKQMLVENKLKTAQELIKELGKEALTENGDWITMHRDREVERPGS